MLESARNHRYRALCVDMMWPRMGGVSPQKRPIWKLPEVGPSWICKGKEGLALRDYTGTLPHAAAGLHLQRTCSQS